MFLEFLHDLCDVIIVVGFVCWFLDIYYDKGDEDEL